jgi:hypothetical protein
MLQRNNNPDSDDEIADNNTQTEMIIEKKKRPPKTQAQLDALAKGRQKMIENKSVREPPIGAGGGGFLEVFENVFLLKWSNYFHIFMKIIIMLSSVTNEKKRKNKHLRKI